VVALVARGAWWRPRTLALAEAATTVLDQREESAAFAVDAEAVPPSVFGLASYVDAVAPAQRIDRRTAIQVPAVKRARDIIAGPLGTLPLTLVGPGQQRVDWQLFRQPERDVPRSVTWTKTAEDLLFEGVAWWFVTGYEWRGYPSEVIRLDPRSVDVMKDGRVHVTLDGHRGMSTAYPTDRQLIRFDSPNDPLLVAGARAIRTALQLDRAAANASDGTPPVGFFTPTEGADPVDDQEIIDLLDDWQEARRKRAVGYVPASLTYNDGGFSPEQLQLAEARQHAVLEIARVSGVDPEELGVSTTSRTYANMFDRRKWLLDFTVGGYRQAIEDRLSMGDVSPRGYRASYLLDEFLRSDALARYQAYEVGLRTGALTPAEVREAEGRPPVDGSAVPAQEPSAAPTPQEAPVDAHTHAVTTFDAAPGALTFDAPVAPETFAVDRETRTIKGLALPYDTVARSGGRNWSFPKGSVKFGDVSRVKLLAGHDWTQAIGRATALEDTDAGLLATFKVARGAEGDRALALAEDGVWDGLSVGLGEGIKATVGEDGVHYASEAPLREISITPCPAYDGARVTQVAADATHQEEPAMPQPTIDLTLPEGTDAATFGAAVAATFAAMANPQGNGPEPVSPGRPLEVNEQPLYRFDGIAGQHCFVDDLRSANGGDSEARQRIDEFMNETFAVTTGNVGSLNPTKNRPELYVPNLTYSRPLWESVSTGGIEDRTPFTVPKFSSASGLVGTHTEGTEPTPGTFTATSQTVTPKAISGKIELNREVLDAGGSPQADAIIWQEMEAAYYEAIETRIAALLNAVPTAELNLAGATDAALVNALQNMLIGLQFTRGGNRFTRLVLDGQLFPALANAQDSTGRKLLPILGATNAQGQVTDGFDAIQLGNLTGRAAWALGATNASKSHLFVPSSVWAWASAPKKFVFEYQVKSVDIAVWGYGAEAVLRDSDVRPIDYTTADA
jgi:HK97 family phage prohead protease